MRRILKSFEHGFSLLRSLGMRRFAIAVLFWSLQRHRKTLAPIYKCVMGKPAANLLPHDPVLVYQMSKVGSTSLVYSLQYAYVKAKMPDVEIYHVHTLINLDAHEKLAREANNSEELIPAVREYRKIRARLDGDAKQHWNAITMVRDPIARHISDYFHHIDRHLPDWQRRWRDGRLHADEVMQHCLSATDHAPDWFDTEINPVLGIDVFEKPFPHETGYCIYANAKATLLLIRLEDMDRAATTAVRQLLGIKNFELLSFNAGRDTAYSQLYQQFKSTPLPAWYVEKAYSSRLAQHFYSQAERDRWAKKWMHEAPSQTI